MSIKAMSNVWEFSKQRGSALLMLLAVADYAKDDGSGAWPSYETLAEKTRMGRRNAIEVIKKLVEEGELIIHQGAGMRGCNVYDIVFPGESRFARGKRKKKTSESQCTSASESQCTSGVNPSALALVNPSAPNPSPIRHLYVMNPSGADSPPPPESPPPRPKSEKPKTKTPQAVTEFRKATNRYPPKSWFTTIDQAVGDETDDLQFWHDVAFAYVGMGWSPMNVKTMLKYYKRREIPGENGGEKNATHQRPNQKPRQGAVSSGLTSEQQAACAKVDAAL